MLPFPFSLLTSKWTYVVLAVVLAITCGVLIWLGGYESVTGYIATGGVGQSWSWRYDTTQKIGVGCGVSSIILAFLISIGTALFGKSSEPEYDEYESYYY